MSTPVTIPALIALATGVRLYFQQQNIAATVTPVGWKERSKIINQGPGGGSRVVFMPGIVPPSATGPSSPVPFEGGEMGQPKQTYTNPRSLATVHAMNTVSIWGVDVSSLVNKNNEESQLIATWELFRQTIEAVHNATYTDAQGNTFNVGLADIRWKRFVWTAPPVENAFGREILAYFEHLNQSLDEVIATCTPQPAVSPNPSPFELAALTFPPYDEHIPQ